MPTAGCARFPTGKERSSSSSSATRSARISAPTTLAELAQIKKSLGATGDRVQVVFVTVDPERDTPEILKAYVGNFGPDFIGLRGSLEQTAAAAKEFKVFYAKVPGKTPGSYSMDHSAASFVFDPAGKVRLYLPYAATRRWSLQTCSSLRRSRLTPKKKRPLRAARSTRRPKARSFRVRQRLAHLLHRGHLDLANPLGADAVFARQIVQRHAARAVVVDLEPALLDDPTACAGRARRAPGRCRRRPASRASSPRAPASARSRHRPDRRSARRFPRCRRFAARARRRHRRGGFPSPALPRA